MQSSRRVSQLPGRTISFPPMLNSREASNPRSFSKYLEQNSKQVPRDADDDSDGYNEDTTEASSRDGSSEGEDEEDTPLLPIFSAAHLDALPVFQFTHTIRLMVIEKCDTVLTWDQLRSPQVSQFLVKPIQQEIMHTNMHAATEYALLANALQFTKEASERAASSGTNKTRAMLCELVAVRLLKEHSTRELIDALSYDFNPLQGQPEHGARHLQGRGRPRSIRPTRISCIEIAIRAQAKKFLAHPMVVQHLEAIWNGAIVFHSAADNMHRKSTAASNISYGSIPLTANQSLAAVVRPSKIVTLYNPKEASLFKLSRLRVPRYRNVLSTLSFAVLLVLFLAVLQERSTSISTLEIIFWVWAAGYMLDEVLGFSDQGFSLYIASFWNTFDLGIVFLLFIHLCLRIYGLFMPDDATRMDVASNAYDVLAVTAILLFPRLFSVLDHYRYFSQLIIAFRMMAADMIAIFVLIVIFCSGFLVSLTLAFGRDGVDDPRSVAYALLQMLLGFTPAAWDRWNDYNVLGRGVLTLFLFVCHFVVVTILITVLTNSFMDIVKNANEEHQYLYAVNTISSVKSDALFAYVPPVNVLQWLLTPLRYLLPFRQYVRLNRTIIKLTHFPILFTIYAYERFVLRPNIVDSIDLIESSGHVKKKLKQRLPRAIHAPSIATHQQEAALDEVFRQAVTPTITITRSRERRKTSNVVSTWMHSIDETNEPPREQNRRTINRLESRRKNVSRFGSSRKSDTLHRRQPTSTASDPNDFASFADLFSPRPQPSQSNQQTPSVLEIPYHQSDVGADEEVHASDVNDNIATVSPTPRATIRDYFDVMSPGKTSAVHHNQQDDQKSDTRDQLEKTTVMPNVGKHRPHLRTVSSATMIYSPLVNDSPAQILPEPQVNVGARPFGSSVFGTDVATSKSGSKPASSAQGGRKVKHANIRPLYPTHGDAAFRSSPNVMTILQSPARSSKSNAVPISPRKRRSSLDMDLVSDIGDNKAIGGGFVGALPASFASNMAHATNAVRQSQRHIDEQRQTEEHRRKDESEMFGRLMMARMNTLEEGFREVVHEVREGIKHVGSTSVSRQRSPDRSSDLAGRRRKEKHLKERVERQPQSVQSSAPGSGNVSVIMGEQDNAANAFIGAEDEH